MLTRLALCLFVLLAPAVARAQLVPDPGVRLAAPFDVEAINAAKGRPLPDEACPAPYPVVMGVEGVSYYEDGQHSVIDPAKEAANRAAVLPLDQWLAAVEHAAGRWVEARPRRPEAAACALAQLDAWAQGHAMLGLFNQQGAYHRKWTLAGAALAFLAIRDAPGLDAGAKARVAAWLRQVALAVMPYYDRPATRAAVSDRMNNHLYWAGLAIGAAAIASDDRMLFEWAVGRARLGLDQVTGEGALPQELRRGAMALHYHLFALQPLAALAIMGAANRVPLSGEEAAALRRLTLFTFRATLNPARITVLAGVSQKEDGVSEGGYLHQGVGLEVALGLFREPMIDQALAPFRPYNSAWLGGPVTLLWRAVNR